ncbi:MAG: hypothetical protein GXO89_17325, partial [Chlorobi bacterium]|nr:hypothetical protein [Chlorobiota bacterium]
MQENIICDTNIWYDIAKGKIKPSQIEGLNLIATGLNIQEIASSPLLLRNIQLVKDTYLSIKEFSSFIIKTSPFEHLFSLFDPNHKSYNNIDSLIDGFEFLLKIEDISSLPQSNIDKMKSSYDRLTGIYKPITDKLNNILEEARKEVASLGGKKIHRKKNFVVSWKKYIAFLINNYTESNYNK